MHQHDDLDRAVFKAYGWSDLLPSLEIANGNKTPRSPASAEADTGNEIVERENFKAELDNALLGRLIALNTEYAANEKRGRILWLRPGYQIPVSGQLQTRGAEQLGIDMGEDDVVEIPVYGLPHAYNVATATAMALYEYCRQYPSG